MAGPGAALFFRDAAHYGKNPFAPGVVIRRLREALPSVSWLAYHPSPPSAALIVGDYTNVGLQEVARISTQITGLICLPRALPDLSSVEQAVPLAATTTSRGSVIVGSTACKVVVVLLDSDVSETHRVLGKVSARVEALTWTSSRDLLCLYDRPPRSGSNGQVARAVGAALERIGPRNTRLLATARAMSVIRDILAGKLVFLEEAPGFGARPT